jgi:spore maturation protein CgeB
MKILSVVRRAYYGSASVIEPMYLYFTEPLRELGHEVDAFDHFEAAASEGREGASETLARRVRDGGYDVVFYQTSGAEPVDTQRLQPLAGSTPIVAWNSDDDWQWPTTSRIYPNFSHMVTTYPQIFERNRVAYPKLLLSQWACLRATEAPLGKDIDFSFAGAVYKIRNAQCRALRKQAGLRCFGRGARMANLGIPYFRGAFRLPWLAGEAIDFASINEVWRRTRVSYTPLGGGPNGEVLSLKSRIFDMGCSGTLMLSEHAPDLERYYEPGRECVTFSGLADCAEKARFFLSHETERARIAARYRERTLEEHLWKHRFQRLFEQVGVG